MSCEAPALSLHAVGRRYAPYRRPAQRLAHFLRPRRTPPGAFWALRGITLDIHRGESVAVLGRNGAGKSTLLQLIAGVLPPTEGELLIRGRVAPLLELGAGFDPEFTGRENIILASILVGIPPSEARRRADAILDFAELADVAAGPLKHYSSGMVARLGFAVATEWLPDILLVDETLAVGDAGFQARCADRIDAHLRRGVTLLYVSHDPASARRLCARGLLLRAGRLSFDGPLPDAAAAYDAVAALPDRPREDGANPPEGSLAESRRSSYPLP